MTVPHGGMYEGEYTSSDKPKDKRKKIPTDTVRLRECAMELAIYMGLSRKKFYDLMKATKLYHMHNAYTIAETFYELMDEEDTDEMSNM